ncbi:hypothetical protein [Streptomyces sp. NPDC058964]|uniref:hypothetical protein n=1 Tax=Streptomyces sp. NPDC058964 TaxID=3346681 RepID=UPI0036799873
MGFEQTGPVTGAVFTVAVLVLRRGIWGALAHALRRRCGPQAAGHTPGPTAQQGHGGPAQRVPS